MQDLRVSTVADVVRRSAARTPERVALRFADSSGDDRTWTYAELDAAVSRAAGALLATGAGEGDRIAAYGKNSDAYLIAFLACARAGLVHVPINNNVDGAELAYLLRQSGSTVALVDPALSEPLHEVLPQTSVREVMFLRGDSGSLLDRCTSGEAPELDVHVSDEDLVQLLYTSGTTSDPKGAMMTHRALLHEYVSCVVALDFTSDDEPLHAMPLYHSAQMHVFLLPHLMIGSTNRLVEAPDPIDVLRRIEQERLGAFFAAPTVWVALANHTEFAQRDLSSLRKAYYGASIMPGPVLERLRGALPELGFYNCFGQSEIGPLAAVLRPEEHDEHPGSAGREVLFVEAKVVDEQGVELGLDQLGEVIYRSPQLCTGYWDKPEETAESFREGWFRSGDLVRRDSDGYLHVVDRIRDVINTGGVLVASREVEDALYTHPAVAEVAVIALPDPKWIESVAAVVVTKSEVDESELVEHARKHLSRFKVPKTIRFVDDLPRNSAGKLLKRVLRDDMAERAPD